MIGEVWPTREMGCRYHVVIIPQFRDKVLCG